MKLESWDDLRDPDAGEAMHNLGRRLWPLPRSLTGPGLRQTLAIIKEYVPDLELRSVPSGTQVFDWTVPQEWSVTEAYLVSPTGERICDWSKNNLHLVGYSVPTERELELGELQKHLFSLPDQPDAIPYITSYYSPRWGFCLSHDQRVRLPEGRYKVVIRSELKSGVLDYGELVIPGSSRDEILISTYVCHPSMANNELSGPLVSLFLALWLKDLKNRRYTYRFFFGPETIGPIAYLAERLDHLKKHTVAGYVLTCIGDERTYSFLPSRYGNTENDKLTRTILKETLGKFDEYHFSDRGSDERQYCSPLADLPVVSVMRSKYSTYPEYHTSLDDLNFVTPAGLEGGLFAMKCCLLAHEKNLFYKAKMPCEPQLGKRGLYPQISTKDTKEIVRTMMDVLTYCDGTNDVTRLSTLARCGWLEANNWVEKFYDAGLLEKATSVRRET